MVKLEYTFQQLTANLQRRCRKVDKKCTLERVNLSSHHFSSSTMHYAAIFVCNDLFNILCSQIAIPPSPFPSFNWIHYSPPCSDSSWDPMCTCSMHQEQAQTGKKKKCAALAQKMHVCQSDISSFDTPTHVKLLDVSKLHMC